MTDTGQPKAFETMDLAWLRAEEWRSSLAKSAATFPFLVAAPIMRQYFSDEMQIRASYEWVAFAVVGFKECQTRGPDPDNISPSAMSALLMSVSKAADNLDRLLRQVEKFAPAPSSSGNKPKLIAFLRAHENIALAFGGAETGLYPSSDADLGTWARFTEWKGYLGEIADRAEIVQARLSADGAARAGTGSTFQGLGGFVGLLAEVWTKLKGRAPSAERIRERADLGGDGNPPFVRFLLELCSAGIVGVMPTRLAIAGELKKQAPKTPPQASTEHLA